jgi:hypothetical protein
MRPVFCIMSSVAVLNTVCSKLSEIRKDSICSLTFNYCPNQLKITPIFVLLKPDVFKTYMKNFRPLRSTDRLSEIFTKLWLQRISAKNRGIQNSEYCKNIKLDEFLSHGKNFEKAQHYGQIFQ